jgi:hypothetical protein
MMSYPTPQSEIKLSYQVYKENDPKPKNAVLFNPDLDQKFSHDVIDDLVGKGIWDENLENQLKNKQLYFKVFREDEDMIPADAVMFENVRLLPNQGLLSLEESLQNTVSWFGSFIPGPVKQTAYDFGNSLAQWTEDKLSGFSAYSGIPTMQEMDEESWHEILEGRHCEERSDVAIQNLEHPGLLRSTRNDAGDEVVGWAEPAKPNIELLGFTKDCSAQPTEDEKTETDSTSKSLAESLLNTIWSFASYTCNNPLKTFTLVLAASSVANRIHLPKINFENQSLKLTNGINTATDILTKLAVAKIATNGIHSNTPLNTIIAGMSLWNPVAATTSEFQVNTNTLGNQYLPYPTGLLDGSFVVAWYSDNPIEIFAQRLDGLTGAKLGSEYLVNSYTPGLQYNPCLATLSNGNLMVTWMSNGQDGSGWGIFGGLFNGTTGTGLGGQFQINTYAPNDQEYSSIASLRSGSFVVVWESNLQDGSGDGVYGQRFNSTTGTTLGAEFRVNTYTTNDQQKPFVTALLDDSFVVVWSSNLQDGSGSGIYAQRFNGTTGAILGSEFQVNTYTTSEQIYPFIASLNTGGFVVTWSSNQDGSGYGIYAQRFNSTGAKIGGEFQVNTYTTNDQFWSSVVSLLDGDFVVVWSFSAGQDGSNNGIFGQRFNEITGAKSGVEFRVNIYTTAEQDFGYVARLSDGSFVVTWESNGQDGSGFGPYARIFTPPSLNNNTLIINEGQTKIVTNTALGASAPNTSPSGLALTITNVTYGRFELVNAQGIPIFNFTQQHVNSGLIQFTHDGGEFAPSYIVKVNEVFLDTTPAPANIIFTNINDVPVLMGSGGSFIFNEKSIPIIIGSNISISDVDNVNMMHATIAISVNFAGTEDVLGFVDQFGIMGNYNPLIGQLSLTGSSSITNYQLALRNVTYSDTSSNPSLLSRTISFTVNDGALNSNIVTRTINIIPVNDAPVLAIGDNPSIFTEKSSGVTVDSNITLADVDNANITNATIIITGNFTSGEDVLSFVNQAGITGIYSNSIGVLSLTGLSNRMSYQVALRNVTYFDTSSNPSLLPRTISFIVNDGELNSNTATKIINIIPVNDAPTLSGSGGILSFTEKNPATPIDTSITVADVDSLNLTNATVKFTSSVLPEDVLSFTVQGGISGAYSNTTGILFLTGSSSVSNYQSTLRSVTYFNPSFNPSAALRTVSFAVNDGELNSNSITRSISVTPVNDPPVLTINTVSITGGQALNLTATQLHAADPDTLDSSLTFSLSSIQFCRFERTSAAGISIITFTQQDISNNQIRIVPTGGTVSAPAYQVSVSDGQYSTTPASASVNFNGGFVPSISVNKLTITQGGVVILSTNQLNAFDADTAASGLTFTASNIRYGTFSIVGSPANPITTFTLQSLSNGFIQFTQDGSENAPSYDISVSDGILATNTQAAVITYININQPPLVINIIPDRPSEKVDQAFSFSIAANTFFDSDPGDQQLLVYSAKMQNGNVLPTWISFDSSNRQFTGKPITSGKTQISVIAKDPSNAIGIANFTMDVGASISQTNPHVIPLEDNTVRNALLGAGISALVGFMAFALKYGIRRAANKKLQNALEANQTDTEKKQREYDNEVIKPIANHINEHLKVTAPFESISTEKVKNFVGAVRVLVSEMGLLGIQYQKLDEANRNIIHTTIIKELKRITTPIDENCCSALLRCGFFKADVTPQQIQDNAEVIAKAVNKALNQSQFNTFARTSDPKNPRGLVAQSVELTPIPESSDSTQSKPEAPRVSAILPKLAKAEEKALQAQERALEAQEKTAQLESEMAEMKKQVAMLLSAQSGAPATIPQSQPISTPSLSM